MKGYVANTIIITGVAIMLASCGSGRTTVLEPVVQSKTTVSHINIVQKENTVETPVAITKAFEKYLRKKLYEEEKFSPGDDITLEYRFIQMNEGSRLARYFWGGIGNSGEGTVIVEVTYKDRSGAILGKIHTEGKIGSGAFGGSYDHALEKAAEEIALYTKRAFKR